MSVSWYQWAVSCRIPILTPLRRTLAGWFDPRESLQLTPGATLMLFRIIGEHVARPHALESETAKCPRCKVWTAPAERILDKVKKCRAVSESLH
jgi:hypothetical protein